MVNKRGQGGGNLALIVLGIVVALVILTLIIRAISPGLSEMIGKGGVPIGTALIGGTTGSDLDFLSYIVGEVPNFLIEVTNLKSAAIISLAIFVILFLIFSDILSVFGTFSSRGIAVVIAFALAIIAANLKFVMFLASIGFLFAGGLGTFAVILSIAIPFLLYIVMHFLFLDTFQQWARNRKAIREYERGVSELRRGIQGIRDFGAAVGGIERPRARRR